MSIYRRRLMIANALKKSDSNINYPGLIAAWSAAGKSNDDADRNVLRDLTGNGHDITLNNFAFSEMSGYGGYNTNFQLNWSNASGGTISSISKNKLIISSTNGSYGNSIIYTNDIINGMNIRVSNLTTGNIFIDDRVTSKNLITIAQDGIYTIPKGDGYNIKSIDKRELCNITIELLPKYPDALVFDGVDDYGANEDMPIQTDYTIIVKRQILNGNAPNSAIISKRLDGAYNGAFVFERKSVPDTWSFGAATKLSISDTYISWQTKNSYNGIKITSENYSDTNKLSIGRGMFTTAYSTNMAFYSAYLFNRSLDEQEIKAFIRKYIDADYLLPSEIPAPDCYYDFTNGDNASETRDTIVDLSGNGNDAKAYNFAWNEAGSGYKDGALQFDGKDDYVALEAFDSRFKTVFVIDTPKQEGLKTLYDQRLSDGIKLFAVFITGTAYIYRADYTKVNTYINGILNKKVGASALLNKKHLIVMQMDDSVDLSETTKRPIIGANHAGSHYFLSHDIYKFLGFKEALTEEQIQYVIKKYNLLDGVDEIEVS